MTIDTILLGSLEKVFLDEAPAAAPRTGMSALRGETVSFQWAACPREGDRLEAVVTLSSPLREHLRLYEVGHVPSALPAYSHSTGPFLRRAPGLFPDPLFPRPDGRVVLVGGQWRGVWIEARLPADLPAGTYPIELHLAAAGRPGDILARARFTLEVIDAVLPEQTLIHTEWFHCDCLAVHYRVPVFSEKHWTLMERYMENAVRYGVNTILTPLFTPPLDTAVGGERPTVQLVDIEAEGDAYRFGFARLKRYLDTARRAGMRYFEMAHLFTQWGAARAPKIMGVRDGRETRLFGWDTDAVSPAYTHFLRGLLTALKAFLNEEGVWDCCWFHISDEPSIDALESYKAARDSVWDLLPDGRVTDALSSIEFYRQGLVAHPIPSNDHIQSFLDEGVGDLWTYYCCGQTADVSNRLMAMPSERTRILGWQLYKFGIRGFLHWGFNFWFSALSKRAVDPYAVTDADASFPSGDPFLVYPGEDGLPVPSIRQLVFHESLQDLRALQLFEARHSREAAMAVLNDAFGEAFDFKRYEKATGKLPEIRESLNRLLT